MVARYRFAANLDVVDSRLVLTPYHHASWRSSHDAIVGAASVIQFSPHLHRFEDSGCYCTFNLLSVGLVFASVRNPNLILHASLSFPAI
jgi:hypothetical protein